MTTIASRGRPAGRLTGRRAAIAALVLAAGIAAVVAFVVHRQGTVPAARLDLGSTWGPESKSPLFYRSVDPPFGSGKTSYVLRFRPHSRFRFGIGVHNGGASPVRIEGIVTTSPDFRGAFRITGLQMQHTPNSYTLDGATSAPLTIPPDGYAFVIPTIETGARCNMYRGGIESIDSIALKYSYRGIRSIRSYSMPLTVGMVCGNPKHVIDRMFRP